MGLQTRSLPPALKSIDLPLVRREMASVFWLGLN
jgi:hypothetical protein